MKRLLIVPAISLALSTALSGCASVPSESQIVSTVISLTTQACKFVPDAEAIAGILAAGDPLLSSASSIANYICNAIAASTAPVTLGAQFQTINGPRRAILVNGAPLVIDGVTVTGHFVH
jgi:hypothetical protein